MPKISFLGCLEVPLKFDWWWASSPTLWTLGLSSWQSTPPTYQQPYLRNNTRKHELFSTFFWAREGNPGLQATGGRRPWHQQDTYHTCLFNSSTSALNGDDQNYGVSLAYQYQLHLVAIHIFVPINMYDLVKKIKMPFVGWGVSCRLKVRDASYKKFPNMKLFRESSLLSAWKLPF